VESEARRTDERDNEPPKGVEKSARGLVLMGGDVESGSGVEARRRPHGDLKGEVIVYLMERPEQGQASDLSTR
jgi:hypothetical protein